MRKLRIYLDTSVINFLFAEDAPDFRRVTQQFFERYAQRYELYLSSVVLAEIQRDPDPKHRHALLSELARRAVAMLPTDRLVEVESLAELYLQRGIVAQRQRNDALHVAFASVYELDVLLSWNFKHLANLRREALFLAVNQEEGYRYPLRIVSPLEVEDEDEAG